MNAVSQTPVMARFPDIMTHNYDPNGAFLRNLCDLSEIEAERVLDRLRAAGRRIKADYFRRRLETEQWKTEASRQNDRFIEIQKANRSLHAGEGDGRTPRGSGRCCA
jgi:hypothetical protein